MIYRLPICCSISEKKYIKVESVELDWKSFILDRSWEFLCDWVWLSFYRFFDSKDLFLILIRLDDLELASFWRPIRQLEGLVEQQLNSILWAAWNKKHCTFDKSLRFLDKLEVEYSWKTVGPDIVMFIEN